jgi:CheY-like chemotaxis protein
MSKRPIFIVEDDPDVALLARHHLEAADFTVVVFPDGNSVISDQSDSHQSFLFSISYYQAQTVLRSAGQSDKYHLSIDFRLFFSQSEAVNRTAFED